jgi:hypothetical protein
VNEERTGRKDTGKRFNTEGAENTEVAEERRRKITPDQVGVSA